MRFHAPLLASLTAALLQVAETWITQQAESGTELAPTFVTLTAWMALRELRRHRAA